jgi:3-deoxy-D-manno-octulosonic-acid transferase
MRLFFALTLYRFLLPLLFITAFPGWILKMLKRGGFQTSLGERLAIYTEPLEGEPYGAVHIHAVSVGETMLALKLIREWSLQDPEQEFVLATGTATGHTVATSAALSHTRVTYSPLDFPSMVRRYLDRFEPSQIVLIEAEAWPHLLLICRKKSIPVRLVNARMSPRSARRFQKFSKWLRPIYSNLDAVAIQQSEDAQIWQDLGITSANIHDTGSLKFDPGSGKLPHRREEFQQLIDCFGKARRIILAASTHAGEETWIANAIHQADPKALAVIAPRHAERRMEVKSALETAGFEVLLSSNPDTPIASDKSCLVIDTTGELRDWTAHADVVIIGKSFLSTGGQNPCEAILAGKPVIVGPHMENFQPLTRQLIDTQSCLLARNPSELSNQILLALSPEVAHSLTQNAAKLLLHHEGATRRIITILNNPRASKS